MCRKPVRLVVPGHGVDGAVDPHSVPVSEFHSFPQALGGEIPREGPHTEISPGQVDRVRAVEDRHPKPLKIACRGKQFRFCSFNFHNIPHC